MCKAPTPGNHGTPTLVKDRLVVLAGGVGAGKAASVILANLPADFPAPVLLALPPDELRGEFSQALKYRNGPRMTIVREGLVPAAAHFYIAPVNNSICVRVDGTLGLSGSASDVASTADLVLSSAAAAYRGKVIGVVLSGDGHDGTRGLNEVTAQGGVRIVQSPTDSTRPQMPSSAVLNDHPNYVALVDSIAGILIKLVKSLPKP